MIGLDQGEGATGCTVRRSFELRIPPADLSLSASAEIEGALLEREDVQDAAVIGHKK